MNERPRALFKLGDGGKCDVRIGGQCIMVAPNPRDAACVCRHINDALDQAEQRKEEQALALRDENTRLRYKLKEVMDISIEEEPSRACAAITACVAEELAQTKDHK